MSFTVRDQAYPLTVDIDPTAVVHAPAMDSCVNRCVVRATEALVSAVSGWDDWHRSHLSSVFEAMLLTHRNIRILLSPDESGAPKPTSVDALSLARLQLESLYTVCLMFEDPKWVDNYVKDGWQKDYKLFLLRNEEWKRLPQCGEALQLVVAELEKLQQVCGVTDDERRTIELEELGAPLPIGVQKIPIPSFPTPGSIVGRILDPKKKQMLIRLYADYQHLCSYVHGLPACVSQ